MTDCAVTPETVVNSNSTPIVRIGMHGETNIVHMGESFAHFCDEKNILIAVQPKRLPYGIRRFQFRFHIHIFGGVLYRRFLLLQIQSIPLQMLK